MNFLLRRRGLGNTSCNAIVANSQTGIQVVRNDKAVPEGDIVFRWGCTSNVKAKTIVNQAKAIHLVANKAGFREILNEKELCPKTWFDLDYIDDIPLPAIIRPRVHSQGKNLYFCKTKEELESAWWESVDEAGYISEFIDKVAEYRVFVVQGRVVCVAEKTPADPKAIAWNVAQGGKFTNVRWNSWPLNAVKVSIEAFNLSGLDFSGVDVMVDKNGKAYILELNSAPSLTSPYRQSCFTKVFDYIVTNGVEHLPLDDRRGYAKYIHPAIGS